MNATTTNAPAIATTNMAIDAVIVFGRNANGPTLLCLSNGDSGINPLSLFTPAQPLSLTPPAQKPVKVEPPKVEAARPVASPDEKAQLLMQAKALGIKRKGLHFCNADTLKMLIGESAKADKAPATASPKADKPAPATTAADKAPATASPKADKPARKGGRGGRGGPRRGAEMKVWLPLSQCLGIGTYTCKHQTGPNAGEMFNVDVAIWDETLNGRMYIAFLTKDERDVMSAEGVTTGRKERHAYHNDGQWYVTSENPKFKLVQRW